ncbi:hypothetical protein [Streptomyces sp. CC208A]|uniref:hypothetical protein n=1 Tax=Streptomyces sp. CC208A TaxID=3044573 RepID=UPI0024A80326|nr:hypothetical protein [Streptomyces sp. CC208A]
MRDLIARALVWALSVLVPHRPGRHSAAFLAERPETPLVDPWLKPWSTPTPAHVRALYSPLRGEDVALVRPYCRLDDTLDFGVIHERRTAAVLATLGVDYPYGYEGDHFETLAAFAAAGVTA